jgi:hypothetical protein
VFDADEALLGMIARARGGGVRRARPTAGPATHGPVAAPGGRGHLRRGTGSLAGGSARAGAITRAGLCLLVLVGGLGGCAGATPTPALRVPTATVALAGPTVPAAARAPGGTGSPGTYPDPALTPGDVFPGVTTREVCQAGYSASVRSVGADEKAAVYRRYGLADAPGQHEVDHFISLELGGSNALTNLWPEAYEPRPGAHEKDRVEDYLHQQVCAGTMTLAQAQEAIRTDWVAVYARIGRP